MKVFLDTNVLLDVLARREPFQLEASRIWGLAEAHTIEGLASAVSFATIYYVERRRSRSNALAAVKILRDLFTLVTCDAAIVNRAIDSGLSDFEDAIQYFSAIVAGADCLVTRNKNHFPKSGMPILTPKEFLATYSFK